MKTFLASAFLAAILLQLSPLRAEEPACCAGGASHKNMTAMCESTFAKLDLNAAQKAKMEKLAAECDKGGCTKESMARMEASAKGILNKKQFATWKATCSGHMAAKS